ncbi:MAG: isoleucine--tRNA ligase [Myxococcales bacterium]|nr:isoleucine--tRNA ligase [Myxococcales bacterium]
MDYKNTIRLPRTAFPMRANLAQREPAILAQWSEREVYKKQVAELTDSDRYVFHDGPPYANGHLHYGTVFNKILKDIVIKYQGLRGRKVRFVPGWDCHGLPIELNVERRMGRDKAQTISVTSLRKACRDEAEKWVAVQREEFKRLGVFGYWEEPYLTLHPRYEQGVLKILAACLSQGIVERGKKPVYWCGHCQTALAEAEVEYAEHTSPSIYVKFPLSQPESERVARQMGFATSGDKPLYAMIWTTTPWTLPANLAIAVHPEYQYVAVDVGKELWLLAQERLGAVAQATGVTATCVGSPIKGDALLGTVAQHPFEERDSPLLAADYVTLDAGTGLVHTAPGHGIEDYVLGQQHGLEPFAPVDDAACFTDEVRDAWRKRPVISVNQDIVRFLAEAGRLGNAEGDSVQHSYPHCWRCKHPVIFRATTQWFVLLDKPMRKDPQHRTLRQAAMTAIGEVNWVPAWGRDRIEGMVSQRPDWCISRQRRWGVPIPAFYCDGCGEALLDTETVRHVAELFGAHGSDIWFEKPAIELVPEGQRCSHCQGQHFSKDQSILDVWFESGASFEPVLQSDAYGMGEAVPADLYLEGSDQHRGWFHSALLLSAASRGHAPYKRVLTHGFVCDDQGRPYSKSEIRRRQEAGEKIEYVEPNVVVKQKGAELLRAWAASQDYRTDPRYSEVHLGQASDSYFKLRNTLRFLLGNLDGYDGKPGEYIEPLDAWAKARMRAYMQAAVDAYDAYDFRRVFQITLELSVGEWSAFYLDVIKDRLYCDDVNSPRRRSGQATLEMIARGMLTVLAPILCFTAEEAWGFLPQEKGRSVFLEGHLERPQLSEADIQLLDAGRVLQRIRDTVNAAMEPLVRDKSLAHRREASVSLGLPALDLAAIKRITGDVAEVLAVAEVTTFEAECLTASVSQTTHPRCQRCWRHRRQAGTDVKELCDRCAKVMETWESN